MAEAQDPWLGWWGWGGVRECAQALPRGTSGNSSLSASLPLFPGCCWGKIYVPLRFGNQSHTKKKEEREKEMILIFFRSRNEAEVSKF